MTKALRIVELRTENVKRVKAVRVVPDPDKGTVIVAGRNGQGKTSVLDAIWFALAGKSAQKETPKAIRTGAEHAYVELDMGDFTVRRTWKCATVKDDAVTTELSVTAKDGATYGSPQKFLDKKLGDLTFDPLAFARMAAKDQLSALLELVELPFDPEEVAHRRQGFYDKRTEVGRDLKNAEEVAKSFPVPDPELPTTEVSLTGLLATLETVREGNREHEAATEAITRTDAELGDAEAALALAQRRHTDAIARCHKAKIDLGMAPEPRETGSLLEQIDKVGETNRIIRAAQDRETAIMRADALRIAAAQLTGQIEELDRTKAEELAKANMPVDGLGFDDEGVTFHDQPFSQASAAEQLRVSMAIGMAADPQIRVMRITDGSLLDSTSMAVIEEMATEHEFQVWIERVDDTGAVGVVIEDGEVRDAEPWPEPELVETEAEALPPCGSLQKDGIGMIIGYCDRPPHREGEPHNMVPAQMVDGSIVRTS